MEQPQDLFGNYKYCEECKRPLPLTYKENLCPSCIEQKLFREVKEYIRENDVNEYDVAQHFHIPHMQVKKVDSRGTHRVQGRPSEHDYHALHQMRRTDLFRNFMRQMHAPEGCLRSLLCARGCLRQPDAFH